MANAWLLKPLPLPAVTATSTSLGDPIHVANDYAGIVWQAQPGDTATLSFDLAADLPVDTVMLFGLGAGIPGSAQVRIDLATNAQGGGWNGAYWSVTQPLLAGTATPASGRGVMLWTAPTAGGPPAAVRFMRLTFSGLGGATAIRVARAVVGKRIMLERNFSHGAAFGVRDLGSLDFSRRGVMLRARGAKLRTVGLTFSNLTRDELEAKIAPLLEQLGNTEFVALCTNPAEDAQRQSHCYFGPLVGDLAAVRTNATRAEAKVNLVSPF